MLKNILNLEGAHELSNNEQKAINGGITDYCNSWIMAGFCVRKGSLPCPAAYPVNGGGGCCCTEPVLEP